MEGDHVRRHIVDVPARGNRHCGRGCLIPTRVIGMTVAGGAAFFRFISTCAVTPNLPSSLK
jgi:hypothetical protein